MGPIPNSSWLNHHVPRSFSHWMIVLVHCASPIFRQFVHFFLNWAKAAIAAWTLDALRSLNGETLKKRGPKSSQHHASRGGIFHEIKTFWGSPIGQFVWSLYDIYIYVCVYIYIYICIYIYVYIYMYIYILAIQCLGCTPVLTCTGNTAKKMEVFNIRVTCDFEALGPTWSLAAQSLKCAAQRRLNEICSSPSVHNMDVSENSVPLNPMVNDHYPY